MTRIIIMAAGHGTRLEPLTKSMSKVMIPLANKPIIEWTLERVANIDPKPIIIVRPDQKDVINHLSGRVEFVYQEKPLGTAHAILMCKDVVKEKFIVIGGDDLIDKESLETFAEQEPTTIAYFKHPDPSNKFGVFEISNNKIKSIEEKPEKPKSNFVNPGLYLFDKTIFEYIEKTPKSERNELEITSTINLMLNHGVNAFEIKEWITIVYPWNITEANKKILDSTGSVIHPTAEIRPGAYIEEPVAIGENAVIGPNCYIRAYSSIGKNCKVGNAVEVKNSIVMDNSYVSHLSYVGDSIVGRNCNIGAGTLFANLRLDEKKINMRVKGEKINSGRNKLGGIVANNVKFGVNCVVMPGKKIWPDIRVPPCSVIDIDLKTQPPMDIDGIKNKLKD